MSLLFLLLAAGCTGGDDMPEDYCDWPVDWYPDADSDGFGDADAESRPGCSAPGLGWVSNGSDCDDSDGDTWPGASDSCDNKDNNCNGEIDENGDLEVWPDVDGDGYGDESAASIQTCDIPSGYVDNPLDCNDSDATAYEDAPEECDNIDNDCDGEIDESGDGDTFYLDADGDGIGLASDTVSSCSAPDGYAEYAGDCDDTSNATPFWVSTAGSGAGAGTWSDPGSSIQDAIDSGTSCVVVLPGNYNENIDLNGNDVAVLGLAGSAGTSVTGSGGAVFTAESNETATIQGFSVTGGTGSPAVANGAYSDVGAGLYAYNSTITLKDIVFHDMTAAGWSNSANASWDSSGAAGVFADTDANVHMEDVDFLRLQGEWGAAFFNYDANITGRRIRIHGCTGSYSIVHTAGSLELDTILISGNTTVETPTNDYHWGGIYHINGDSEIRNLTVVHNHFPSFVFGVFEATQGGAILSAFSVESSIVAFNHSDIGFYNFGTGAAALEYSLLHDSGVPIDGTIFETSNLQEDPLFVSASDAASYETNDYRLQPGSPASDSGSPVYSDPDGSTTDMGAYGGPYATW
jgi:hypothetical protein